MEIMVGANEETKINAIFMLAVGSESNLIGWVSPHVQKLSWLDSVDMKKSFAYEKTEHNVKKINKYTMQWARVGETV